MSIYNGFSSRDFAKTTIFGKTDIEIVKQDLLNHIYTELGEREHLPGFGTRIPSLIFEQIDQEVVDIIREDLLKVFTFDPRIKVADLQVYPLPNNNAIVAVAKLWFIELQQYDTLNLTFNQT